MADYLITVLLRVLSRLLRVYTNLDYKPSMNNVLLLVKGVGGYEYKKNDCPEHLIVLSSTSDNTMLLTSHDPY